MNDIGHHKPISRSLKTAVELDFCETRWYIRSVPNKGLTREHKRPWHLREDLDWSSGRRFYETNEETNTPLRDGLSN
jgi:hypothetical protein